MYGSILLSDEQKDLLTQLVERHKNLPKDKRGRFYFVRTDGGRRIPTGEGDVRHSHAAMFPASQDDIDELIHRGLLASAYDSDILTFVLSPEAFVYFEKMKEEMGRPVEQIVGTVRTYLDTAEFQRRHPGRIKNGLRPNLCYGLPTLIASSQISATSVGKQFRNSQRNLSIDLSLLTWKEILPALRIEYGLF